MAMAEHRFYRGDKNEREVTSDGAGTFGPRLTAKYERRFRVGVAKLARRSSACGKTSQRLPGDLVDPAQTASSMRADLVALGVRVGWVSGRQGE
jgi:hypothetical protein